MKKLSNIRLYAWLEFVIWLLIISIVVFGIRFYNYEVQKQYKSYQIFLHDADGLIEGSPVRFLGIQIGHVTKIQIVSSKVYIKFIVTQKGLELPLGVVATVEGSGLGGSKSVEIYPPSKADDNRNIIQSKDPVRLGRVISLFKNIFKELDGIITTFNYASKSLDLENQIPENVVIPNGKADAFIKIDQSIDSLQSGEKTIRDTLKLDKLEKRNDEFLQRESD